MGRYKAYSKYRYSLESSHGPIQGRQIYRYIYITHMDRYRRTYIYIYKAHIDKYKTDGNTYIAYRAHKDR
jgi:hypothetical protein